MLADIIKKAGFLIIAVLVIWFIIMLVFGLLVLLFKILLVIIVVSLVLWGIEKIKGK